MNCLLLTTTIPQRFELFEKSVMAIETCSRGKLKNKVVSVDVVDGYGYYRDSLYDGVRGLGWKVIHGSGKGMIDNLLRGLNEIPSGWTLYCEDHVLIEAIPDEESMKTVEDVRPTGKPIKYICYNTHVLEENLLGVDESVHKLPKDTDGSRAKFINDGSNYQLFCNSLMLIKNESIKDAYYLNFPAAIVESSTLRTLVQYANTFLTGYAVETGVSQAWFETKFNELYEVAIYVKPSVLNNFPMTFTKLHKFANMKFRNNCPELLEIGKKQSVDMGRKML